MIRRDSLTGERLDPPAELAMWAGKRPADMTRDELIEALNQAARLLTQSQERERHTLDTWSKCIEARAKP